MFTDLTIRSKPPISAKMPDLLSEKVTADRLDDGSLIHLVALEQAEALSELYNRYGRLLFSIAYTSIGDQAVAEEIVQDVFTRVWKKAYTYDGSKAKVITWLVGITRNRSIDELRKEKSHPEKTGISWSEISKSDLPTTTGPEEETELSLRQKLVRDALETLSPNQRELLALAYFKGYSMSKIADQLGIPLGTVKTRVRKAMQQLRLVLSETMMEDH